MKKYLSAAILMASLFGPSILIDVAGAGAVEIAPVVKKRKLPPHGIPADVKAAVERAANRIEALYPVLGPKLGAHLVNPNIVLMLADERGLADDNFYRWDEEDLAAVAKFNEKAEKMGLRMAYMKPVVIGQKEVDGWFENLAGYERVSEHTKLKGIPQYKADSGWKGLEDWKTKAVEEVKRCEKEGIYKGGDDKAIQPRMDDYFPTARSNDFLTALLRGVAYGYPDTAIDPPANGKSVLTKIPYGDFYRASEPNYSYSTTSDWKAVNENVNRWSLILGEYYHCPQYLKLAQDAGFQKARRDADAFGNPDKFED